MSYKNYTFSSMTRFLLLGSLVFLCLCSGCRNPDASEIIVEWKENKASGIIIPDHVLKGVTKLKVSEQVIVTLKGGQTPILGEYQVLEKEVVFHPVVPFTRGQVYEIKKNDEVLAIFSIAKPAKGYVAAVQSVWPLADTLPENLLKFYINFSQPMQQGDVLQYITLVKDGKDTLKNVFLDLQQELWSNDDRVLTLWLDPGRIKRDLQPNQLLGPPLEAGHQYTLVIDSNWRTADGVTLQSSFSKKFSTKQRDDKSPDVSKWDFYLAPEECPLVIVNLREPMDARLVPEMIRVFNADSVELDGYRGFAHGDSVFAFQPTKALVKGNYYIQVDPKLEDIAGNNLMRPFDNDITKKSSSNVITRKSFRIKGKNE